MLEQRMPGGLGDLAEVVQSQAPEVLAKRLLERKSRGPAGGIEDISWLALFLGS